VDEGLLDLAAEYAVDLMVTEIVNAPAEVQTMLGGITHPRIWEGGPPEKKPEGAPWDLFYTCILVTVITPVTDIFALTNNHPGDHVIGTIRVEIKVVGAGTGFKRLKPVKRWIYATFEGADGADVEGGSIGSCTLFKEWPREKEPTDGGTTYYHSGYWFDFIVQRGE